METTKTKKSIKEKRQELKSLTEKAKMIAEISGEAGKVNDLIINLIYNEGQKHEYNTFKGWKEKGFQVNKGSKAYLIWGQPKKASQKIESARTSEENKEGGEIENKYKLFPVAHIFRDDQVTKIAEA